MSDFYLILVGLFLPLFPLSMVFNAVFSKIKSHIIRYVLLLVWPQIGLVTLFSLGVDVPGWVAVWGLLTALLYAFRLLTIRELGLWASFIATSAWALLWIILLNSDDSSIYLYALAFSVPLMLFVSLGEELTKRFGAAYVGIYSGLAQTQPRFSGVLVMVVLAVVATPIFPAFFAVLHSIVIVVPTSLTMAILAGIVWTLWTWAGARVLHGLIVGPATQNDIPDLTSGSAWRYSGMLVGIAVVGLILIGGLP